MTIRDQQFTELIRQQIIRKEPAAKIVLFGSRARGDMHPESDWDILILLPQAKVGRTTEMEFRDLLFDLQLETGEGISTFVYSEKEWEDKYSITPLYENIKNEGVLLV